MHQRKFAFLVVLIWAIILLTFHIFGRVFAFTGPSSAPYSGYGFIKSDAYDAAIGVQNPRATTTLLITGSDSTSNNFSLKVENSNLNLGQVLKIRNNQVVTVGKDIIPSDPGAISMTQGFANPYYLLQAETIYSPYAKIDKPGFSFTQTQNSLFVDNWKVNTALQGLLGGNSIIRNFNSIQAEVIILGDLTPASNVIGYSGLVPSSPGVFGAQTGVQNYAFPAKLSVNSTTIVDADFKAELGVEGDVYVKNFLGIGKDPAVSLDIAGDGTASGRINFRYAIAPLEETYGQLYSDTNGVVLSSRNAAANYGLHFNVATTDTEVEQVRITTAGVGIGVFPPTAKLDVAGTIKTTAFQLVTGAQNGYVLQSDVSGLASWQPIVSPPSGTAGQTLRHSGTDWISNSLLYNNGTSVGVGTTSIDSDTLLKVGEGGYLQFGKTSAGNPNSVAPGDCDSSSETGRLVLDINDNGSLYICNGPTRSWDNVAYWYDPSWSSRKQIIIDRTKVSGSLSNFPVFINTTAPAAAQDDCDDILFTSSDGTKLSHQIEKDSSENACASGNTMVAWVKIPSLSSSATTTLYMYYGNSGASNQQNSTSTWDSNYKGVYHLQETLSDTEGIRINIHKDSTVTNQSVDDSYANDIVTNWHRGLDLDGFQDYAIRSSIPALDPTTTTISAWVQFTFLGGAATQGIFARSNNNDAFNILLNTTNDTIGYYARKGSAWSLVTSSVVSTGQWYYITLTHSANTLKGYLNGQLIGSITNATDLIKANSQYYFGNYNSGYLYGYIDEVRVSDVDRGSSWILTEYNNQNSPQTFYTIGAENEY